MNGSTASTQRRASIAVTAAMLLSSPTLVSARRLQQQPQHQQHEEYQRPPAVRQAQSTQLPPAPPRAHKFHHDQNTAPHHLTPTFSCGSIWTEATTCSKLCGTGSDEECPSGEYCYAGIPCPSSMLMEHDDDLTSSRRQPPQGHDNDDDQEMKFVCGFNYDDALSSCNGQDDIQSWSMPQHRQHEQEQQVQFCPTGQSNECPSTMECYAGVICPRATTTTITAIQKEEEVIVVIDSATTGMIQNLSSYVTEPLLLLNSTTSTTDSTDGALINTSYYNELASTSSPKVLGLLSQGYC